MEIVVFIHLVHLKQAVGRGRGRNSGDMVGLIGTISLAFEKQQCFKFNTKPVSVISHSLLDLRKFFFHSALKMLSLYLGIAKTNINGCSLPHGGNGCRQLVHYCVLLSTNHI